MKEYILEGLECGNCAAKMERALNELDVVDSAHINFMTQKLRIDLKDDQSKEAMREVQSVITGIESHVKLTETKKDGPSLKYRLYRILASSLLLILGSVLPIDNMMIRFAIYFVSYLVVGGDVLLKAIRNIGNGQIFDENFLMSIATIGAFLIGEYPEGVAVMLFYQVGELFQTYAVGKSRDSIADLMDIRPDAVNLKTEDGIKVVDPNAVAVGDIIIIKAGEKIPLDAIVLEGHSMLDTKTLTGESLPRDVSEGSEILSGCININGLLEARVTKVFGESTVSKILDLVENASNKKSQSEQFITKFARYYTPVVVIIAALLAVLPPLLLPGATFNEWIYRSLSFLVVSCPCALVISIPLSFFGGIGGASRQGILIKGSNYLEALAQTEVLVFDKTGTLTKGVFEVQSINALHMSEDDLLEMTAYAESYSNHPISDSLKKAYADEIDNSRIGKVEEIAGHGVIAEVDGKSVAAGNIKLMEQLGLEGIDNNLNGTIVHCAIDNVYQGYILISDELKEDAELAIQSLKGTQIKKTVMLTGDHKNVARAIAKDLRIDEVHAELLPQDKVTHVEALLEEKHAGRKLAFVGDGINDAPVLALADIGIAMGGLGSDAAIEAADIVIMTDEPSKISTAINISHKTLNIVYQNIIFAIGIKVLVLILSALGYASMWAAIFADVGVTILAVLNAFRALSIKNK